MTETFTNIRDQFDNHPAHLIYQRFKLIDASVKILNSNYIQLIKFLEFSKSKPNLIRIVGTDTTNEYMEFLIEVTRLLHNYVASVQSLIDHTRGYYRKHYEAQNKFQDYQNHIDTTFKQNSLAVFVKDLRQYCQHYSIPNIYMQITASQTDAKYNMKLDTKSLMQFSGWHKLSKDFLKSNPVNIDLESVIKSYRELVIKFHSWFRNREIEINRDKLDDFKTVRVKALQSEIPQLIENSICQKKLDLFEESILQVFDRNTKIEIKEKPIKDNQRAKFLIDKFESIFIKLQDIDKKKIMNYYLQGNIKLLKE